MDIIYTQLAGLEHAELHLTILQEPAPFRVMVRESVRVSVFLTGCVLGDEI